MSSREMILEALQLVLAAIPGARVLRNEPLPGRIPAGGLMILRDGDPGQPEVTMSPLRAKPSRCGAQHVEDHVQRVTPGSFQP